MSEVETKQPYGDVVEFVQLTKAFAAKMSCVYP